jgi:hypothetical protein
MHFEHKKYLHVLLQEEEPNERRNGKLCDYLARNPHRSGWARGLVARGAWWHPGRRRFDPRPAHPREWFPMKTG